ncbi:MAG TPA: hypothetical protein VFY15_02350 [Acidimicrobiia bacterium]|nr:hypothetical protein [Acidimicrobiia bacterium]
MDDPQDQHDLGDAARRGLQRAGIHLMKAAIEVVAGIGAFLEELNAADGGSDDDEPGSDAGPQRIPVE